MDPTLEFIPLGFAIINADIVHNIALAPLRPASIRRRFLPGAGDFLPKESVALERGFAKSFARARLHKFLTARPLVRLPRRNYTI